MDDDIKELLAVIERIRAKAYAAGKQDIISGFRATIANFAKHGGVSRSLVSSGTSERRKRARKGATLALFVKPSSINLDRPGSRLSTR